MHGKLLGMKMTWSAVQTKRRALGLLLHPYDPFCPTQEDPRLKPTLHQQKVAQSKGNQEPFLDRFRACVSPGKGAGRNVLCFGFNSKLSLSKEHGLVPFLQEQSANVLKQSQPASIHKEATMRARNMRMTKSFFCVGKRHTKPKPSCI